MRQRTAGDQVQPLPSLVDGRSGTQVYGSVGTRTLYLLLSMVCLSACASEPRVIKYNPCHHWSMGVAAPKYMEAWVEALYVKDDHNEWVQIPQGVVGEFSQTAGWPPSNGVGSGGTTTDSAGAPIEVYVRWQSLAEPQTYKWRFTVPESMRQALVRKEPVLWEGQVEMTCRSDITIGVAPGGRTVVWIGGGALSHMEVLRGQAEVEPLGPDQGKHEGRYVRFSDEAKQYVEKRGIPYGSWDH